MDEFEKELRVGFLEEAKELLTNAEKCFLDLEQAKDDPSIVEQIFRLAHNLKGSAGAVGFSDLKDFTHKLESLLLRIKNKELSIEENVINILLRCNDYLNGAIDLLKENLEANYANPELANEIDLFLQAPAGATVDQSAAPTAEPDQDQEEASTVLEIRPRSRPETEKKGQPNKGQTEESIRVSLSKIDSLMNNVGELVIMQTVLSQQKSQLQSTLLQKTIGQMSKIVKEIQGTSMGLRMLPIKHTFQKMQRIVRDTSVSLNKKVRFEVAGEDTEFDKTVLEQLGDPLVHLIRNAVDHGIETPEERQEKGKDPEGTIKLSAYHRGDKIIIEIKDDGKGLNPEKLKQKAIEKNLINEKAVLSETDAYQLIFLPGFSTKTEITDVSGRGVGMDVVKTNITQLQGEIILESELGKGTCFKISLPLTLAIVDSVVVALDEDRFVIPITQITESLQPKSEDISFVNEADEILVLRGESLPVYRLNHLLKKSGKTKRDACESIALVVRDNGQRPFAVLVDDVVCQQQVVVKRLGQEFKGLSGFTGAAILGDGKANLILDLFELVNSQLKLFNRSNSDKKISHQRMVT